MADINSFAGKTGIAMALTMADAYDPNLNSPFEPFPFNF